MLVDPTGMSSEDPSQLVPKNRRVTSRSGQIIFSNTMQNLFSGQGKLSYSYTLVREATTIENLTSTFFGQKNEIPEFQVNVNVQQTTQYFDSNGNKIESAFKAVGGKAVITIQTDVESYDLNGSLETFEKNSITTTSTFAVKSSVDKDGRAFVNLVPVSSVETCKPATRIKSHFSAQDLLLIQTVKNRASMEGSNQNNVEHSLDQATEQVMSLPDKIIKE